MYLILNIVYKKKGDSKIYSQKPFEFKLKNRFNKLILGFILNLSATNNVLQK